MFSWVRLTDWLWLTDQSIDWWLINWLTDWLTNQSIDDWFVYSLIVITSNWLTDWLAITNWLTNQWIDARSLARLLACLIDWLTHWTHSQHQIPLWKLTFAPLAVSNSTTSGDAKLAASNNGVHPDWNWTSGSIPYVTKKRNMQTFTLSFMFMVMFWEKI